MPSAYRPAFSSEEHHVVPDRALGFFNSLAGFVAVQVSDVPPQREKAGHAVGIYQRSFQINLGARAKAENRTRKSARECPGSIHPASIRPGIREHRGRLLQMSARA